MPHDGACVILAPDTLPAAALLLSSPEGSLIPAPLLFKP